MQSYRKTFSLFFAVCMITTFSISAFPSISQSESTDEQIKKAIEYKKSKDYQKALAILTPLAKQGNPIAQHNLGEMYHFGEGVAKDDKEAEKWFRKSAEQGNADGEFKLKLLMAFTPKKLLKMLKEDAVKGDPWRQYELGYKYDFGEGVPQDYEKAAKWYRKSAEQGVHLAQYNLGTLYEYGYGVQQDLKEAMRWYRKAAEQGMAGAQSNIGRMYGQGRGVDQNYTEAEKWLRKAAEQGYAKAQNGLAQMYFRGLGVSKDYVLAHMWAYLATKRGERDADKGISILEKKMTPAQIENAKEMAKNWKPEKQLSLPLPPF